MAINKQRTFMNKRKTFAICDGYQRKITTMRNISPRFWRRTKRPNIQTNKKPTGLKIYFMDSLDDHLLPEVLFCNMVLTGSDDT
jgi:hypothetical protein